jgi:hypothetical protein
VFYMDVAKADLDVAYVAMVVHVCFKVLFPMFHLFSIRMLHVCLLEVVYVSHICCIYFCNGFKCFCKCLRRTFQVFHLSLKYVASVAFECFKSRSVLHHPPRLLLPRLGVSSSRCHLGIHCPLPLFLNAGDVRGDVGPAWARETEHKKYIYIIPYPISYAQMLSKQPGVRVKFFTACKKKQKCLIKHVHALWLAPAHLPPLPRT